MVQPADCHLHQTGLDSVGLGAALGMSTSWVNPADAHGATAITLGQIATKNAISP